nr:hypothetical protein [Tanacetum cinerariifolium]
AYFDVVDDNEPPALDLKHMVRVKYGSTIKAKEDIEVSMQMERVMSAGILKHSGHENATTPTAGGGSQ